VAAMKMALSAESQANFEMYSISVLMKLILFKRVTSKNACTPPPPPDNNLK
jgi:hypothetical protein